MPCVIDFYEEIKSHEIHPMLQDLFHRESKNKYIGGIVMSETDYVGFEIWTDFGFGTIWEVWVLIASIATTVVLITAKNPHDKGTDERLALRLCRISLGLIVWSFSFGVAGFPLAIAGLVLAIIGIVKGRTRYGVMLIISSIIIPIVGMMCNISYIKISWDF